MSEISAEGNMDDLNWLILKGHTVIFKPVNLDPHIVLTRVEKNKKLVVQVSQPSITLGLSEATKFVKRARGIGV